MGVLKKLLLTSLPIVLTVSAVAGARAESLSAALLEAYRKNPTLNAARAGQRATDETVPQALSGWRPTISATGTVGQNVTNTTFASGANAYIAPQQENLAIKLDQPLFRGFRTVESTAAAEARVSSGREQLLATEQTVLLNAISAYVNVLRDRQIVSFRRQDLGVLQGEDHATSERFKAGELTKTDVAISNAQVASARAQLASAIATMQSSEASFEQFVGHKPGKLSPAPFARPPASLEQSYEIAHRTNPNILAAAQNAISADHNIGVVRSALLPQADLQGLYNFTGTQNGATNSPSSVSSATLQGVLTVPIYEAGLTYSQVRQAKQQASQSHITVIDTTRQVRQQVASAWEGYVAARQAASSNATGVSASQLAFQGTQQEYQVGSRSTVDVLNSEQTLLNARIALASAQHDEVLASYQLQSAVGHLTGDHLHLGRIYDPSENYHLVRNKWIGTDAETLQ